MGTRQAGQHVLLGVLCWGCLAALPACLAVERGASVSRNVPTDQARGLGRADQSGGAVGTGGGAFPCKLQCGLQWGGLQNRGFCKALCMH